MGVMYYLTMASLSSVGNFNELGFRLLYPGTIMAVIGSRQNWALDAF